MSEDLNYTNSAWEDRFGSKAVRELHSADHGEAYSVNQMHVYELADGRYAIVSESGCSCYCSSTDADIEITHDYFEAKRQFEAWDRRQRGVTDL